MKKTLNGENNLEEEELHENRNLQRKKNQSQQGKKNQIKIKNQVKFVIRETVRGEKVLFTGIVCAVFGAILTALLPPLVLAKIIDRITSNHVASVSMIVCYFFLLACTGLMEAAREALLTVF